MKQVINYVFSKKFIDVLAGLVLAGITLFIAGTVALAIAGVIIQLLKQYPIFMTVFTLGFLSFMWAAERMDS